MFIFCMYARTCVRARARACVCVCVCARARSPALMHAHACLCGCRQGVEPTVTSGVFKFTGIMMTILDRASYAAKQWTDQLAGSAVIGQDLYLTLSHPQKDEGRNSGSWSQLQRHFDSVSILHFGCVSILYFGSVSILHFDCVSILYIDCVSILHFDSVNILHFDNVSILHFVSTSCTLIVSTSCTLCQHPALW